VQRRASAAYLISPQAQHLDGYSLSVPVVHCFINVPICSAAYFLEQRIPVRQFASASKGNCWGDSAASPTYIFTSCSYHPFLVAHWNIGLWVGSATELSRSAFLYAI
jgi:hypothetical protein